MLSRILYSTNIVKGESRKPNLIEFYAKPYPIFYKYSERRKQRQMKTEFFEGGIKGMSSSKIEEVGEARRSMSAVEGAN